MPFYAFIDDRLGEALELFVDRREAELVVEAWDLDEPNDAGVLHVEPIEFELEASPN